MPPATTWTDRPVTAGGRQAEAVQAFPSRLRTLLGPGSPGRFVGSTSPELRDPESVVFTHMSTERALEVTRATKRLLAGLSPVQEFFNSEFARRLRKRLYRITPDQVVRVAETLDRHGVRFWLAGGWGVDALLGRQTRSHADLDICIDHADEDNARAALSELGFDVVIERAPSGLTLPIRSVLRNAAGRTLDLILISTEERADVPTLGPPDLATGTIRSGGTDHGVGCLSADFQIAAHTGYAPQERDRHDVGLLCERFGRELPPVYERHAPEPAPSLGRRARKLVAEAVARLGGTSALVFRVPEADEVYSAVGAGRLGGLPAHITVLFPFKPVIAIGRRTRSELHAIAARTPPFDVTFGGIDAFGTISYLTVEPADPPIEVSTAVWRRWPRYPPYGDPTLEMTPHLTLATGVVPSDISATVAPYLPVKSTISSLTLMTRRLTGRWRVAAQFPLGGGRPDE